MKLKEDFVAMSLYIIAAIIMILSAYVIFIGSSSSSSIINSYFSSILVIGFIPVFFFCTFLVAIGRIIDLLNQINQKLNKWVRTQVLPIIAITKWEVNPGVMEDWNSARHKKGSNLYIFRRTKWNE